MNASRCRSVRRDHKAVKRRPRVVLVRERQVIARRRLAAAVRVNEDGPILGRRRPVLEMAERFRAIPHGGMATMSKVVAHSGPAPDYVAGIGLNDRPGKGQLAARHITQPST